MTSQAFLRFLDSLAAGKRIRETASDARLRPISHEKKRGFLHASLAAYVAAWDAYLNNVVREFRVSTRKPLDGEYSSIHSDLEAFIEKSLKKFNTPNSNNSRILLMDCTGYDPINDWNWPRGRLNGTEARDFLDQILKVRHSFAHGLQIPLYDWTESPGGQRRLTVNSLERIEAFLKHLTTETDLGLRLHAHATYPSANIWP
jgi:hypothetical protein